MVIKAAIARSSIEFLASYQIAYLQVWLLNLLNHTIYLALDSAGTGSDIA
jgi:hypothetical protein